MGLKGMPRYHTKLHQLQASYDTHFNFTAGVSGALPALTAFLPSGGGAATDLDAATTKVAASTGLYDFFLARTWLGLTDWSIKIIQASYSASGACKGDVTIDNVTSATPKVRITFYTAAGAPVDLASGDIVRVTLELLLRKQ